MRLIAIIVLVANTTVSAQIKNTTPFFYFASEYSKSEVLSHSKSSLIEFLGANETITKIEIYPLSSNGGNEISALRYKCIDKHEAGIVLGFYGRYVTAASQNYNGHSFKVFNLKQSHEFLNKVDDAFTKNSKYLKDDTNNNNIFFRYDDVDIIITSYSIRLLWQNFDSVWYKNSFDDAKKEFDRAK